MLILLEAEASDLSRHLHCCFLTVLISQFWSFAEQLRHVNVNAIRRIGLPLEDEPDVRLSSVECWFLTVF